MIAVLNYLSSKFKMYAGEIEWTKDICASEKVIFQSRTSLTMFVINF
jgi:hypothetical protein